MSLTETPQLLEEHQGSKKRNAEEAELEIDLQAPEPPSKKALRKAKRSKNLTDDNTVSTTQNSSSIEGHYTANQTKKRSEYGIWIGNLSFGTTKDDLLKFLTGNSTHPILAKDITRVHLPLGKEKFGKQQNKGFAYIDFMDSSSLSEALELSETLLDGRRVLIKNSKSFEGRPDANQASLENQGKAPSKKIFIGNLSFDTTADDLERHFGQCGPIVHTHMATFEDTGKCKGYAWIEFEELPSSQAAMRGWIEVDAILPGKGPNTGSAKQRIWLHKIDGRKLRMEFAEDKTTRYNKRFGKNSKTSEAADDVAAVEEVPEGREGFQDVSTVTDDVATTKQERKPRAFGKGGGKEQRGKPNYSNETVQKLTGAMVEGKGQKVVFD